MDNLRRIGTALASAGESTRLGGLVLIFLGSVLITGLVGAAGPSSTDWLFQSPVSPIGPGPGGSPGAPEGTVTVPAVVTVPAAPEGTVTGPGLVAVPAAPNFVPWLVGILLVAAIVGAAMSWSRRRGKGEGSA